jgi:uncharacterized pyridoxamine 5'-phosphate oxidase family protein
VNKGEILAFMTANPTCHLATVEGNKPRVRAMVIYRADENGIIFQSWTLKDVFKQLSENAAVELCFNNYQDRIQVRISGTAELLEDMELKKEVLAERQYLKKWVEEVGDDAVSIYRLTKPVATVWTRAVNFAPKDYIQL